MKFVVFIKQLSSLVLRFSTVLLLIICARREFHTLNDSIEEEMNWFFWNEGFSEYFETIISCVSFSIYIQIIAYIDGIEATEHFENFY